MLVFIKKSLEGDVSGLETSERGIGLMGFGVSPFLEQNEGLLTFAG